MKSSRVRKPHFILSLVAIFLLTLSSSSYAVDGKLPHEQKKLSKYFCYPGEGSSCHLKILENGDWKEVSDLLKKLSSDNEQVNLALIARLKKETKAGSHESGSYGEYYLELLQRVTNISDPSIIEPLVDSLGSASGVYVPNSLAKFGDKSLEVLIKKYDKAQDTDLRNGILFTIEKIIQKNAAKKLLNSNAATYKNLKALLLRGLKDTDPFVREQAIITLVTLGDHSVMHYLEEIVANDTYAIRGGGERSDLEKGTVIYPLRELAQEAIAKLK
jgi:HEAT repeat protein